MSPIGADVVIVGDLTKKKILPGISSANIQ
jgi:hypothetical protein